jgi:integrase
MAGARARHGSYLFQRGNVWWIRLRSPGARKEHSLGTTEKLQAEALAGPMIGEHKAKLLAARPRLETTWQHTLEPGREHVWEEGGKILATDKELFYIGLNGAITRTEPNGGLAWQISSVPRLGLAMPVPIDVKEGTRPTVATKNGDDAILETYLNHRNIIGYDRREAETVWAIYKALTDSKPLKDAGRDDGRKLVQRFKDEGNKSATITKKVGWLRAAVQLAIDEDRDGKLRFNPFSNVVPKNDDEQDRVPLDDADMKACKRDLDKLSKADQSLFRILATTGMRLSEAFQIEGESKEKGVRFSIVGSKTEQSKRRVPLPADLLPYLPKAIKGPLFARDTADATVRSETRAASKRLNHFLNECGIADPRKVIHSMRHRAQDRLRAAGVPQDVREALLGHSKVTVGEGYGIGFPVPLLKRWIDKIGF